MKFIRDQGVWHLIDENAPQHACVIATLRSEVEVMAMKEFCDLFLTEPDKLPGAFSLRHGSSLFNVVPERRHGKLVLHITGEDGTDSCLETEFAIR